MTNIEIYIDGSCSGNRGPGGYAAVCVVNGKTRASSGYTKKITTNNAMELRAAIQGLYALRVTGCNVTFYTDSQYLITCFAHDEKWLSAPDRKNGDLWIELIKTMKKGKHSIQFVKVPGHQGNRLNEIADREARAACAKARHEMYGR